MIIDENEIREKLTLTDDQLFEEVGLALSRGAILGDPRQKGAKFYARICNDLQGTRSNFCSNAKVKSCFEKNDDRIALVAAIIDVLTENNAHLGITGSLATVAVLILRTGVGELCKQHWS